MFSLFKSTQVRGEQLSSAASNLPTIRQYMIGDTGVGKTALVRVLYDHVLADPFPSGLRLEVDDPREAAELMQLMDATNESLRRGNMPSTLTHKPIAYQLFHGERSLASYHSFDCVGQVLTGTTPTANSQIQKLYQQYMQYLPKAHVLWVLVPLPPETNNPRDVREFRRTLRITDVYLRAALRLAAGQGRDQGVSVGILLTKIDTRYDDAESARHELDPESLTNLLRPLVQLSLDSDCVSHAAIMPISSLGLGNTVAVENSPSSEHGDGAPAVETAAKWTLKTAEPTPFNLDTLATWTLLTGFRGQSGAPNGPTRHLETDLSATTGWIVPVKGSLRST